MRLEYFDSFHVLAGNRYGKDPNPCALRAPVKRFFKIYFSTSVVDFVAACQMFQHPRNTYQLQHHFTYNLWRIPPRSVHTCTATYRDVSFQAMKSTIFPNYDMVQPRKQKNSAVPSVQIPHYAVRTYDSIIRVVQSHVWKVDFLYPSCSFWVVRRAVQRCCLAPAIQAMLPALLSLLTLPLRASLLLWSKTLLLRLFCNSCSN